MRPDTQLDYAIFQLTPTRTRCELHVAAQGVTYKLASGLLKPFVSHLRAAEEQLARGGYSIRLEPPDPGAAPWFTKGTMERFVRFVSTPEVLERVSTVEVELTELEENIRVQSSELNETNDAVQADDQSLKNVSSPFAAGMKTMASANSEKLFKSPDVAENAVEESTKQRILRALEARRMMLQKEQGMAFARAIAAGFSVEHMGDLVMFAEYFGATRLREACIKFMALCKKRQEAGLWLEDLDLAASENNHLDMAFMGGAFLKSRDYPDSWSDMQGRDDLRRSSFPLEGKLSVNEEGAERLTRRGSLDEATAEYWQMAANMRPANGSGLMGDGSGDHSVPKTRPASGGGRYSEEMQPVGMGFEDHMGNGEYRHSMMAPWQGLHPNQYIHNAHPFSPHGLMHPAMPAPYGYAGAGRAPPGGLPYPPYLAGAYMGAPYGDNIPWQGAEGNPAWMGVCAQPPPLHHWPGAQGYNENNRPESTDGNVGGQSQETNSLQAVPKDGQRAELTPAKPSPASSKLIGNDTHTPEKENQTDSSNELDAEAPVETTRRLPRRSPSPARRSASPMRRVQIGRSGQRRSGMVVIRNINYIAPNGQNQSTKEDNDNESSGSWSEGSKDSDSEQDETLQAKAETVRVSVQDVIGLFENPKRETSDTKKKSSKKGGKRSFSKSTVAKREAEYDASNGDNHNEHEEDNDFPRVDSARDEKIRDNSARYMAELESNLTRHAHAAEQQQSDFSLKGDVMQDRSFDDMLILPEREGHKQQNNMLSPDVFTDQKEQLDIRGKPARDDSFMVMNREDSEDAKGRRDSRLLGPDFEMSGKFSEDFEQQSIAKRTSDDSFMVLDRSGAHEGSNTGWRVPFHLEAEMPFDQNLDITTENKHNVADSFEPDDLFMVPERNKAIGSRSRNTPDDDMQLFVADMMDDAQLGQGQEDVTENTSLQEVEDRGEKPKETNTKKAAEREAKAKAMQDILERRKAALGRRPNPLAEAQLRAEKLRAYKAGLQKSKKEKEEEERKRIEDLKNQRRERIAARSNTLGSGPLSPSSTARTINRASPKSSPTALSVNKLNGSFTNGPSSLSPKPKTPSSNGNRLSRPSLSSPKTGESVVTRSVPSLSELRKESQKSALSTVRASTGSTRASLLKKSEKHAELSPLSKANGHTEEKKRPAVTPIARKGIPPAKDLKGENVPSSKPTKTQIPASKPQKKVKPTPKKETVPVQVQANLESASVTEAPVREPQSNGNMDSVLQIQEVAESTVAGQLAVNEDGCSQTGLLLASEKETGAAHGGCQDSKIVETSLADSAGFDESSKVLEEQKEDSFNGGIACQTNSQSGTEDGQMEMEMDSMTDEVVHPPGDLVLSVDDSFSTYLAANGNDPGSPGTSLPAVAGQCDPSPVPNTESLLATPSKSLPSLHEAIQQAHSPEATPLTSGSTRSRKKWGDSKSQKTPKDHAKGLKRLLLLGRKSSKGSTQNASDWGTSDVDEDVDEIKDLPANNGSTLSSSSTYDQASMQPLVKLQNDNGVGNSSSKGSRSFFSLSTFRGKSETKA